MTINIPHKCIRYVLLALACITMVLAVGLPVSLPVQAAEASAGASAAGSTSSADTVTVPLPYSHIYYTDDASADDAFAYAMMPLTEGSTLPEGSADGQYVWTIHGTDVSSPEMRVNMGNGVYQYTVSGVIQMQIPAHTGQYQYQVKAYVPDPQPGYTYDPHTYTVEFNVYRVSGAYETGEIIIFGQDGYKHERLDLDPSYTNPTPAPEPTPTPKLHNGQTNTSVTTDTTPSAASAAVSAAGHLLHRIAPKTGDIGNVMLYLIVILIAVLILVAVFVERRRRQRSQAAGRD